MNEIILRAYEERDWDAVQAVHDEARMQELHYAGQDAAFLPLSIAAEREGLFTYTLCVAEADGRVRGFVAYKEGELGWLYVGKASMRRGIGRTLVQYVLEHTHARPVELEVLAGNTPAISLYTAMGFAVAGTYIGVMPGNESFPVTVYRMEKE